ncbi:hypothetical protein Tco_0599540 [Tanacetum coccineum]
MRLLGRRFGVRTYLLGGAIDGSEANGIIRDPQLELESSRFTFDLVPLSYESVDVVVGENWLLRHKAEMETDIQKQDKIEAKNDKTEQENGKSVKQKSSQSQIKSKSTPGSGFGKSIENRTQKLKLPKVGPPIPT